MTEKTPIYIPRGRFVSGDLLEMRTKDNSNRPIKPEDQRYEWGIAVPKNSPDLPATFQTMLTCAQTGYASRPDIVQRATDWFQTMTGFSMKVSDGDKPAASTGKVNENTVGHYVFWFSSQYPPQTCDHTNTQIDAVQVKRGYFVDVSGTVAVNGLLDHNAGIYLNAQWIRLLDYGPEIVSGISANDAFAGHAAPAPTSAPVAPAAAGMPGQGQPDPNPTPAPVADPMASAPTPAAPAPQPAPAPTASPATNPAHPPATDVLAPAPAPVLPGMPTG